MKIRDVPQTGSVGDTVTYQNRYGLIRRRKVIPRNPQTPLQFDYRSAFERARQFWGTFTDEQYAAWTNLAKTRQTHAVLGESSPLSGYELAVQINVHLATVGLPMTPTPSPVPIFPNNPVSAFNIIPVGKAYSLQLVLSGPPVDYILVLGARPQSPGVSYVDHYQILGLLPAPVDGVCDITELYLARFKLLPPRKRIWIQVLQQINGWRDLPKTLTARTS